MTLEFMRSRRKFALFATFGLVCALVALMFLTPLEPLSISVGSVNCRKSPGGTVWASFVVTNTSRLTIQFMQFYDGRLRIENAEGWTASRVPLSPILEAPTTLEPGETTTNQINLPKDVRHWQIGYEVHTESPRHWIWRRLPRKLTTRFSDAIMKWVSDKERKHEEAWSAVLDAKNWVDAHPGEPVLLNVPYRQVFPQRTE
jgi:hypothetical protein